MKVTIRDDEYAVEAITEHDILALTEFLQQQDREGVRKAKDFLVEIMPGLEGSGLVRGDRLLLLLPELFLLVTDLQEALLNSPEYAAAKSRLSTVKDGDRVLKAIEAMSPVASEASPQERFEELSSAIQIAQLQSQIDALTAQLAELKAA